MPIFQCNLIAREEIHIKLEADNKQDAAKKAMKMAEEHGDLVLWKPCEGMWAGPEETEFDEEVEVIMALDGPIIYWDEPEFIEVEEDERR